MPDITYHGVITTLRDEVGCSSNGTVIPIPVGTKAHIVLFHYPQPGDLVDVKFQVTPFSQASVATTWKDFHDVNRFSIEERKVYPERPVWETRDGGCHIFALAAARVTGWEMRAAMRLDSDDEDNAESGLFRSCTNVVHVYLVDPDGNMFDAFGQGDAGLYMGEKESELGWQIGDIVIDAADIDDLVTMGWLMAYSSEDLDGAVLFAKTVLADAEYYLVSSDPGM